MEFDLDENFFYQGLYRQVQDTGMVKWYVAKTHSMLELDALGRKGLSILEIGGNLGEHLNYVRSDFSSYLVTDYRDTKPSFGDSRVSFQIADVHDLPFQDSTFDRVIVTCVFHHLDFPETALAEILRVVKNEGQISVLLPCDPGLFYRVAKIFGPARKWKRNGIKNPKYYHYQQHKNHFPGLLSIFLEICGKSNVSVKYWPFKFKSWNLNLFTALQITVIKEHQ
jgi:phosphatidylethanolamine/phosphatidyl-N-methylethanolamine N-methyltransferase